MNKNWQKIKLATIAEITAGQGAPQSASDFDNSGIPFVRAGSLDALVKGGKESDCERVSKAAATKNKLRLFPPGTVLFAKSGMSAKLDRVYQLKSFAYVVNHLAAVIPNDRCDASFLLRWLQANPPSRLIKDDAYPSIRLSDIEEIEIPLPLPDEQRRIATILDKADNIRRKRQESMRLTEEFIRSTFLEMFGDLVSNQKGWDKVPIKELGNVTTGNTPSRECSEYYGEGIEWIKSDNINTPYHFLTEAKEHLTPAGQKVGRIVPENSTLVTCIAGSPDCIGNAAIANRPVAFNQQINAVTPLKGTDPYFLYAQILVGKKLIQGQSTESMKGMVSKGKFENIFFLKPPANLQIDFGKIFIHFHGMIQKTDLSNQKSVNLFNSLVQQAFRGEL